jgi:PhnB protein
MKTNDSAEKPKIVKPVRDGFHTASPYLIVANAGQALEFYTKAFGAQVTRCITMPGGKIMHAEFRIGDSILMLADEFPSHEAFAPGHFGGSPMLVVLCIDDVDARVSQAVAAGATVLRPVEDQFSGDKSGTILDPFGHKWTLTTHIEDVPEEDLMRRFAQMMGTVSLGDAAAMSAPGETRSADTGVRKAAWILGAIAALEGGWVVMNLHALGWRFIWYLGFVPGRAGTAIGWIAALITIAIFVALALRLPSVRANLFRFSFLKVLALLVAVSAGILEEVMFRRWTMNFLQEHGYGLALQVLGSSLIFGLLHGVWGLFGGNLRAAAGAIVATGLLGIMLALVFIAAGRSLAPCVTAHFFINALIEPGIMLAAVRGEMSRRTGSNEGRILAPQAS